MESRRSPGGTGIDRVREALAQAEEDLESTP